jgi:hypothetical protein
MSSFTPLDHRQYNVLSQCRNTMYEFTLKELPHYSGLAMRAE